MRLLTILLSFAAAVAVACADDGTAPVPTLTPTATTELSAREILRRSDTAMNRLRSVRVRFEQRPTVGAETNPARFGIKEYVAPDRAHYYVYSEAAIGNRSEGEVYYETVVVGARRWLGKGDQWNEGVQEPPFSWPRYDRLKARYSRLFGLIEITDLRIDREDELDGMPVWVISYSHKEPSIEGPFDVFITDWIARDTFLLLRRESHNNDPYGDQAQVNETYYDFNASIAIEPPTAPSP